MKEALKVMLSSRKFVALLTGVIASVIALALGHFMGETEKAMILSQEIAALIMVGVSIYAGSTAYEDASAKAQPPESAEEIKEKVEAVKELRRETLRLNRTKINLQVGINEPKTEEDDGA